MENHLVELNNKLEKYRSLSVMKNKVKDLQTEVVWALVCLLLKTFYSIKIICIYVKQIFSAIFIMKMWWF